MNSQKRKNKKTVVAIFAHPDDEAFGPSGTLIKLAKKHEVYLLCATRGEAGGNHPHLAQIRSEELKKSAKIIGIKKVYFLGFTDGTLSNSLYHSLAKEIERKLKLLKPEILISYEPRGISGHIDHITVAMVTSYVFQRLLFVKTLMQHCITDQVRKKFKNDYFIYFPPGYKKHQIDRIENISNVWNIKLKAMLAHKSQFHDAQRILKAREGLPKEEYFLITQK